MESYSSLAAVERTFQVIEVLIGEVNGLSVSELVNRTQLSKSMVSRILTTLNEIGYVERDPNTRYYKLSLNFLSAAYRHINAMGLEDIFYPMLERVADRTGELVQLAVVKDDGIFFIAKIEGRNPLRVASMLGKRAPYHATAVGKVWLASLKNEEVLQVIVKTGLKAYTDKTVTDVNVLLSHLEEIRKQGYAVVYSEINQDVTALAVPIYDKSKTQVVASLVVAAPHTRMTKERIEELEKICKEEVSSFDASLLTPFGLGYQSKKLLQHFSNPYPQSNG